MRDEVGDGAFRRLAHKVDLELLARVAKSDCEGREPGQFDCSAMDWFLERARALGVEHRPPAPILLGRHLLALGLKPGPRVGEILKAVYEQQMDRQVTTLEEAIEQRVGPGRSAMTMLLEYGPVRSLRPPAEARICEIASVSPRQAASPFMRRCGWPLRVKSASIPSRPGIGRSFAARAGDGRSLRVGRTARRSASRAIQWLLLSTACG